ncbi:hypothetical protein [Ruminiclostridium cellobioparum]|uniref:hypothetical protein n=1 Tax=Ruminiclostridium cellobioparum TaxID=29355 RepID=UPI0004867508|nr:hypothetical protein [Ruminiclostridium cellobioparum]
MKKVISLVLLIVIVLTSLSVFTSTVSAKNDETVIDEKSFNIEIEKNDEEKDIKKLFTMAKSETEAKEEVELDKNNNIVYKIKQNISKSRNSKGDTIQKSVITKFYKIQDEQATANLASPDLKSANFEISSGFLTPNKLKGDGKWDTSSSGYMSVNIYWTESLINNKTYAKLDSANGNVSQLNSGVQVWNLKTTLGQSGITENNGYQVQTIDKDFGQVSSFTQNAPTSWYPVYAQSYSAVVVGCTMTVKLGRSSTSTWTDSLQVIAS